MDHQRLLMADFRMNTVSRVFVLAAASLVFAGAHAQTSPAPAAPEPLTDAVKNQVLERVNTIITKAAFVPGVDFSKWTSFIAENQSKIDGAKSPDEFATVINQALAKFGASHIVFNTPQAANMIANRKFAGLGITPSLVKEGIQIEYVFAKSAAADAGLKVGDIIIEADGKKPTVITALRGEKGTKVKIKVKSVDGSIRTMEIERREFSTVVPESLTWVNSEVARLTIPSFMTYSQANIEALMKDAAKAKSLIVDLRGNGGGVVFHLYHLLGYFLPNRQPAGAFINRDLVNTFVKETSGNASDIQGIAKFALDRSFPGSLVRGLPRTTNTPFKGQLIVLINGGTGSASEMFAAAAKDVVKAPVIGSRSAGAVLASLMVPLPHDYMMQYPFQDYVTVNGLRLEGNGVKPDIEAKTPTSALDKDDPGIQAALNWLKKNAVASK
jgi:carboxyl-terminal processing protease